MNKKFSVLGCFFLLLAVCGAETAKTVAHSVADWDAAGDAVPAQGFRNWSFGYYENKGDPASFRQFNHSGKKIKYWGDGNFTQGAVFRNTIAWSTHKNKYTVVRRWTAPEDGAYTVRLAATHLLKIKGEVSKLSRRLDLVLNGKTIQQLRVPGRTYLRKEFYQPLKKGDTLDFAAESWGGSIEIEIVISKAEKGLAVITGGKSEYQIVIPENDPGQGALKAAKILQRVLKESTSVELPIVTEDDKNPAAAAFYIGRTRKGIRGKIIPEDLQVQEYVLGISGKDIFLCGVNEETRYFGKSFFRPGDSKAVIRFLEDFVHARFLLPGPMGEEIPVLSSLVIPEKFHLRHKASFPYHIAPIPVLKDRERFEPWATAMNFLDRRDAVYFYGHSWPNVIPAAKYGKTHPEYYVLQNGKRRPDKVGSQLCISNKEVRDLMLQSIEKAFAAGIKFYQLSQSDAFFACECPECVKLGPPPVRVWNYHVGLAGEIYRKYPDRKINILAYEVTMKVPGWIREFPPNVIIELTKYDEKEFDAWKKQFPAMKEFMVYDYNWGAFHETGFLPKRTPGRIADQLLRYHKNGVINIYNCGFSTALTGLEAPVTYIYGRLLDDVSLNPNLLLADYCTAAFGRDAGPFMNNFFSIMHKYLETYPENAYFTDDDPRLVRTPAAMIRNHYPAAAVRKMEEFLSAAEKSVSSPKQKMRLKDVRLHFNYMKSVVKAFDAYSLYQLAPDRSIFQIICEALREREQAIDAIFRSDIPALWKSRDNRQIWLAGGTLSGKLGAPFTWNYREMEKSGVLPGVQTKMAKAFFLPRKPALDDLLWNKIPAYELEKVTGGKAGLKSSFQLGWTASDLYMRFTLQTPELAKKQFVSVGKGHYIGTECLDVQINPTALPERYFQFIFSPAPDSFLQGNMNIGRFGADPQWNILDRSWDGKWQYEFKLYPDRDQWTALLRIPVSSLAGFEMGKGRSFTMNIGRVCGRELFLWSPNPESQKFGNTAVFGNVFLE